MSLVLRRYLKANGLFSSTSTNTSLVSSKGTGSIRSFSDEKFTNEPQFSHSTIMVENGLNVHELPLVIRKLKTIPEIDQNTSIEPPKSSSDSLNYPLIQEEFMQCLHLRDVFSLLTKCTKITPNIALGAIERIYDLEKNPPSATPMTLPENSDHINLAKGAILDKLLKVVMKTEDTQTILIILNTMSTFMDLYKPRFSDELLMRVIDNRLTIEQLCQFLEFLIKNKANPEYSETIDKLWVGFLEREQDIDAQNIVKIFHVLNGLKSSKRTILTLVEQKFADVWPKISVSDMQDILNVFDEEKYISLQSCTVLGTWFFANIHAVNQEAMLDIVLKLTRLRYTDNKIEKAVEKYMRLKGTKIESPILVVAILNYCLQFQIRNEQILNACCEYFLSNAKNVPNGVLKSMIYPFGYLNFDPIKSSEFWALVEIKLDENFYKISTDDICSIILSMIYVGKRPLDLVNRLFNSEYLLKISNPETLKKLYLIDTALSLECSEYSGPHVPKDQCPKPVSHDPRTRNIIKKTKHVFDSVLGGANKFSVAVQVPNIYSDETYLIDILLHSAGFGSNGISWKSKAAGNENVAILIHLPDHYCSDNDQLVGSQVMRKKHLKMLGLKVVSLKYSILSQYYTSCNTRDFRKYLEDNIGKPEESTNV